MLSFHEGQVAADRVRVGVDVAVGLCSKDGPLPTALLWDVGTEDEVGRAFESGAKFGVAFAGLGEDEVDGDGGWFRGRDVVKGLGERAAQVLASASGGEARFVNGEER